MEQIIQLDKNKNEVHEIKNINDYAILIRKIDLTRFWGHIN